MDLDTAASLGEALGGLAIMATLLFGLRQVIEVNRNRRYEISQTIAKSLENPLVQRGFSTFGNVITKDSTIEDLMGMTQEQKDATNAVIVLMANHAVMTFIATFPLTSSTPSTNPTFPSSVRACGG